MSNLNYLQLIEPEKCEYQYKELKKMENISGSSFYIFDANRLHKNLRILKEILGDTVSICFSMKANPWLVNEVKEWTDCLEVCSPGELKQCLTLGVPTEKIILDGLMKTEEEICAAISCGVTKISVDSPEQLIMINENARILRKTVNVLLRLSSGNQFGMEEDEIIQIIQENDDDSFINIEGLHYYSGTQKKNSAEISQELDTLTCQINHIEQESGRILKTLEIGGGAGVPYFQEDIRDRYVEAWDTIQSKIYEWSQRFHVVYEAGRILGASAGIYVTKVLESKQRKNKKILILDGGIHHFSYFGQIVGRKTPFIQAISDTIGQEETVTLCGSLCTAQDILAKNVAISGTAPGTYILFHLVGAYSVTECCVDFLSRSKPAVLMKSEQGEMITLRGKDIVVFTLDDKDNQIKEKILSLINEGLERNYKELEESCSMERDLMMDSLDMVSLQLAIEDEFHFEFDPLNDDFEKCFATYGSLCAYVTEKLSGNR